MNFSFKRAEDSPGFLLWQLTNQWQRQQRYALSKLGLTHAQFVVLATLLWLSSATNNSVTQKHIGDLSKIDKMSMSDLIATLVQKKLICRSQHEKDRRAYSLTLTKKAREKILKAIPIVESIDAAFFNADNQELMRMIKILNRHI